MNIIKHVKDYITLTINYKVKLIARDIIINYDGSIYMNKCKVNNVDETSDSKDDIIIVK